MIFAGASAPVDVDLPEKGSLAPRLRNDRVVPGQAHRLAFAGNPGVRDATAAAMSARFKPPLAVDIGQSDAEQLMFDACIISFNVRKELADRFKKKVRSIGKNLDQRPGRALHADIKDPGDREPAVTRDSKAVRLRQARPWIFLLFYK